MNSAQIILFLNLGTGEVFLIVLMILVFFGADKIPEIARGLGKGMREMKNATSEIQREIQKSATDIQRDVNLGKEGDEIQDAANNLKKHLSEGLTNIENHYNEKPESESTSSPDDEDKDNPLVPPDAIKRD
jgi:sec-independent protein translocase protein TatA